MTETKKINLSAMTKQNKTGAENQTIADNTPEKTTDKISGIKINLSSIKSQIKEKPVVKAAIKKEAPKDERTLYMESLTSKMTDKPEKLTVKKETPAKTISTKIENKNKDLEEKTNHKNEVKKLQISALKRSIEKKSQDNIKRDGELLKKEKILELKTPITSCNIADKEDFLLEKLAQDNKEWKNNSSEVFHNYESEYKKKEWNILEWIEKIKNIANIKKLSKTNKIFLASIIWITIAWLGFLFQIDPETHSLDNYKASILTLAWKKMTADEVKTHQGNIQEEIEWKLKENNLWGYNLWFEILVNEQWDAVYKFEGNEYKSKQLLDEAIYEKLEELKKDRIRDYFKTNSSAETSKDLFEEKFLEETPDNFIEQTESAQEPMAEENINEPIENQDTQENQSENSSMNILMKNYSEWWNTSQENNSEDESINEDTPSQENIEEENFQQEETKAENNNENYSEQSEIYEEFMFEEL